MIVKTIKEVLKAYTIRPHHIERITDKLFKVTDGQHVYAVKKSALNTQSIAGWETVYHQAYAQNLLEVLPVYLTRTGYLYEEINETIYYITPWIDTQQMEQKKEIAALYHSLGRIHAKTKQSLTMDPKATINQFNAYKEAIRRTQEKILGYVKEFEKNRYMSPFELQVCTHYRDLELVLRELERRTEQFVKELADVETWNYCLCHGSLTFSHLLYLKQTHIVNWEKAHYGNAVLDLSMFLQNQAGFYDVPTELLYDSFSIYLKENDLSKSELCLLVIYLLDTSNYIAIIEIYLEPSSNKSMIEQVKHLQQAYRGLSFALNWSNLIGERIEPDPLDESPDS